MILVDTSIWADFFRRGLPALARRLEAGEVLTHPFVEGEIMLGFVGRHAPVLKTIRSLPMATQARHEEVYAFVQLHRMEGAGIGWVDAHLIVSALVSEARLWTRDRGISAVAHRVGVGIYGG